MRASAHAPRSVRPPRGCLWSGPRAAFWREERGTRDGGCRRRGAARHRRLHRGGALAVPQRARALAQSCRGSPEGRAFGNPPRGARASCSCLSCLGCAVVVGPLRPPSGCEGARGAAVSAAHRRRGGGRARRGERVWQTAAAAGLAKATLAACCAARAAAGAAADAAHGYVLRQPGAAPAAGAAAPLRLAREARHAARPVGEGRRIHGRGGETGRDATGDVRRRGCFGHELGCSVGWRWQC